MDDVNVELEIADLERAWTARRSELSQRLETAVQGAIAGVLDAAAELRRGMDQDAAALLQRVRQEHSYVAGEIAALQADRDGLAAEIADTRQRAEQEAEGIREAARDESAAMLRDAEQRRVELNAEIARLEQQLAQVSSGIQALLQDQIGRVRAGIPDAADLLSLATPAEQVAAAPTSAAAAPSPARFTPPPAARTPAASPPPAAKSAAASMPPAPAPAPAAWPAVPEPAPPAPSLAARPAPAAPAPRPAPPPAEPAAPAPDLAALSDLPDMPPELGDLGAEPPPERDILDEGELFDLATGPSDERSLDEALADLGIDAALAPIEPSDAASFEVEEPSDDLPVLEEEDAELDAELAAEAADPDPLAELDEALSALPADLGEPPDPTDVVSPISAGQSAERALRAISERGGDSPPAAERTQAMPPQAAERPEPMPSPTRAEAASAPAVASTGDGAAVRIEVAVTATPSFARALELQRGIQRSEGVRQVQALQFERGTLVLAVEYDAGVDLTEALLALPNGLELVDQSAERVELRFPPK